LIDFCDAETVGSSALYIEDSSKVQKKQAITLDDWTLKNNISRIDFIKMDIEGAEIQAMQAQFIY
jgi:FkbM family methyltransferase